MTDDGFHTAHRPTGTLYLPDYEPLLVEDVRIEVDLGPDPPTARVAVAMDPDSATSLDRSGAFGSLDLPEDPWDPAITLRLLLRLRPDRAAAAADLLRAADDPAGDLLRHRRAPEDHPELAWVEAYELEEWAVSVTTDLGQEPPDLG